MHDHYFSNFRRPPVPNDLCKDSATRYPRFWRRRFLKVFIIYGHGGHLGQRTATILAIVCSPNLRRLHMKFEQNWLRGFRGEVVWIYERADDGRKVITIAHPARDTPNGSPLYSCQISSKYQSFGAHKDASQNSTSREILTYEESAICLSWTQHDYWSSSSSLPNIIKLSQTVWE